MATALITGGTSGIGAAFARALAQRGYDLVLVARDEARLASAAASFPAGTSVETISADLSDRVDVSRIVERLSDASRPIDLLVNNAGFGIHSPLTAEDTEPHDRAIEVMIRTVLVLGGAAGRTMRSRGRGSIINISSTAGFMTMGSYSAVKAWVTSFSEGLAVELRGTGVSVTAVCPGWVRTEFHDRAGISTGSIPKQLWVDVDRTVEQGLRDAERGKIVSIPSKRFAFLMGIVRHLPRHSVYRISGAISSSRRKPAASSEAASTAK